MNNNDELNAPSANTSACDELRELLPEYIIGATTSAEKQRVQELMRICPELTEEMAALAAISEGFLTSVPPVVPPAHLRANLLSQIAAEADTEQSNPPEADPAQPTAQPVQPQLDSRRWVIWGLVAAVLILLLATNIYWIARLGSAEGEISSLENQQSQIASLLAGTNIQRIALGAPETPLATLFWDQARNEAALYTEALPALDANQTYQLWLIGTDELASAGLFRVDQNGRGLFTFTPQKPLTNFNTIGISIEPASGSEAPTSDPIAVGAIE